MKKLVAIVAVAAAGLGVLYLFIGSGDEGSVEAPVEPLVVSQESEPDVEPILDLYFEEEPLLQPSVSVSGWVLSLDGGAPVPGASVVVSWGGADGPRRRVELISDDAGAFNVAGDGFRVYRVEVTHANLASEQARYQVILTEEEPLGLVEIWMTTGGAVSGRVYDALTQEGISGVEIGIGEKRSPGAITDEKGLYRLGGVGEGDQRVHFAKAKGYLFPPTHEDGLKVSVVPGEELRDVDIALEPGVFAAIEGIVIDESEERIEGAEVTVWRDHVSTEYETNLDGSFLLDDLEIAGGYYVDARIDGHVSEELGPLGLTVEGIDDLVLTLRPTSSISGTVVDLAGTPITRYGITVHAFEHSRGTNSIGRLRARLGEKGEFLMEDLSPGSYGLIVDSGQLYSMGFAKPQLTVELGFGEHVEGVILTFDLAGYREQREARLARRSERAKQRQIDKAAETKLFGQVMQVGSGKPVKDFTLQTFETPGGRFTNEVVHDEEGRFSATKREGRDLDLTVTSKGYSAGRVLVGDAEAKRGVIVRLRKGAVIEGEVMTPSGQPVAGASIYIGFDPSVMERGSNFRGGRPSDAVSMEDGSFTLDTLSDEPELLFATHPAYAMGSTMVSPTRSRATRVKIVLSMGGSVEGTVRQGDLAVSGRTIMVLNEAGTNLQLIQTPTDRQGYYRYDRFVPGRYTLYTSLGDGMRIRNTKHLSVEVEEGRVTVADFNFPGVVGTLEGIVRLDGTPLRASIGVTIASEFESDQIRVQSNGAGEFVVQNLPAGMAEVSVMATDDEGTRYTQTFELEIEEGATVRRDIDLSSGQ